MPWSTARRSARLSAGAGAGPQKQVLEHLVLCGAGATDASEAAETAGVAAGWTNRCRELVDAPANEMTPAALASAAEEIADTSPSLSYTELDEEDIEAAGLALFAAVARGSTAPARLIVLRYEPSSAQVDDVVAGFVGKAVTFDSGGLAEAAGSHGGHEVGHGGRGSGDCSHGRDRGARAPGAVSGSDRCVREHAGGRRRPPRRHREGPERHDGRDHQHRRRGTPDPRGRARVRTEPRGHAPDRPGDAHRRDRGRHGRRLRGPLRQRRRSAGAAPDRREASGDRLWPWPLHASYDRYIESPFADVKNSSLLRQGTPAYAARFLQRFAGDGAWAHVDMAGTGYLERGRGDYYHSLGATGFGVRLATELVRGLAE